jgi:chorismate dehydratase
VAKTKLSIVRYLNAVPLAWSILEGPDSTAFDSVLSAPSECADQLAAGSVDIGLIPSIEYQRIPGCRIIAGPAVACRHRVRSVLLISQKPLYRVRTVAADTGSRTSVVLAQIIFDEFYHVQPAFKPAAPDLERMLAEHDAALVIGDTALKFMEQHEQPNAEKQQAMLRLGPEPLEVFDLAERWKFLTGLPFVFAFWAARQGFDDIETAERLRRARDYGVAHIAEITDRYSSLLGLPAPFVREYLEENVSYYTDAACLEGLRLFYEKAARLNAIKAQRALSFL